MKLLLKLFALCSLLLSPCSRLPALTTVSDMTSIGSDADGTDLLYLINVQSTGAAKDRKMTLSQLVTWLEGQGIGSGTVSDGSITNAKIASNAAIALSKLATDPLARANHTGTQPMSTISDAGALATLSAVTSATITDGTVVNADIGGSAAIALSKLAALTASRATVTDSSGVISASSVTSTELGYLSGVTSGIQTQLSNKQAASANLTALASATDAVGVLLSDGSHGYSFQAISEGGNGAADAGAVVTYGGDGELKATDFLRLESSSTADYQQWALGAMNFSQGEHVWTLQFPDTLTGDNTVVIRETGGTVALLGDHLGSFAATTSAQLRGVLSDEDGTGAFLTTNGSGASLTSLNASNISSGSLALARIAQGGATTNQVMTWNGSAWAAANASSSGHTIAEEGSGLTSRATLNFIGGGVTAADNSGSSRTDVTVTRSGRYRSQFLGAAALIPRATNPAGVEGQQTGSNLINTDQLTFPDGSTTYYAQFGWRMPDDWNGGTLKVKVEWMATSGSGAVVFSVSGMAVSDDDALDTAFGTAQTTTDTATTNGDYQETPATSAITLGNTPAAGDWIQIQIARDPTVAGDTLSGTARVLGVTFQYLESTTEQSSW